MTELALLAAEVGVSERTLRRALNEGALRGARPTARTVVLPLRERQYVRRSWALLSGLRAALRTEHNVRFALLFGSAATGHETPESDLDLLVDLRDPSLERLLDLSARLSATLGREVDLVRLEDAEAEPAFLADVVADGRVLVDRAGAWPRRSAHPAKRSDPPQREADRARSALAGIDRLLSA